MKQVRAIEHGWLNVGSEGDLTASEADALSAAESVLPKGCLEWGRNRVKFKQFCGVVQIQRQLQIEILPKVFPHQTPEQQRTTLIEMLDIAGDIEGLSSQKAGLATSSHRLLDVFIRHFLKLLEVQLQQGLLRDYQDVEDTLDQVRGRIDLIRQQRENLFKPQRLACRFNELVVDIPINRLLHSALLCIAELTSSPVLRQHIQGMRMRFAGIGVINKGDYLPQSEDLNRMQGRYTSVVELARLFIAKQYLDARAGQQQVYSLLFDMNQLFERFVAAKLRPVARRIGLRLREQGPRKYLGEDSTGKGRLLMRPDISLINTLNRPVVILDTKWKILDTKTPLSSLSPADLYQLSAYASTYRCSEVMLLYPEQDGFHGEQRMILNLERAVTLTVVAVPLGHSRMTISGLEPERKIVQGV
ncbi:McrC family protein [Alloalcanivorax xenomutans]|uniref:McrC family protein n=1 Tax=Alloalcanivorax xenomutans TaxID=1094342 RepID=UPI00047E5279